MDTVIEIVQTDEKECSLDCYLWVEYDAGCRAGWHKPSYEPDGICWNPVPTDKCPGPGKYRLVMVEEE